MALAAPQWHNRAHTPHKTPSSSPCIHPPSSASPNATSSASSMTLSISATVPPHNTRELTREMLVAVLNYFSTLLPSRFDNCPVRLVVHGGASMLLHPDLDKLAAQTPPFLLSPKSNVSSTLLPDSLNHWPSSPSQHSFSHLHRHTQQPVPPHQPDQGRTSTGTHGSAPRSDTPPPDVKRTQTRDVDIIARSFDSEWFQIGITDASDRLKQCIYLTAKKFGLGLDWMNADPDIALPMAFDPVTQTVYDPIHTDALRPNNVALHTVYTSPNGLLSLISVTPFWAVALKLVRFTKSDPGDICLILRNGTNLSGTKWSVELVERWLMDNCWPMGYANYDPSTWAQLRAKIEHVVAMVKAYEDDYVPPRVDRYGLSPRETREVLVGGETGTHSRSLASTSAVGQSSIPVAPCPSPPPPQQVSMQISQQPVYPFPFPYPPPFTYTPAFSPGFQLFPDHAQVQPAQHPIQQQTPRPTEPPPRVLSSSPPLTTSSFLPRSLAEWVTPSSPAPAAPVPATGAGTGTETGAGASRGHEDLVPFLQRGPERRRQRDGRQEVDERRTHTWPLVGGPSTPAMMTTEAQDWPVVRPRSRGRVIQTQYRGRRGRVQDRQDGRPEAEEEVEEEEEEEEEEAKREREEKRRRKVVEWLEANNRGGGYDSDDGEPAAAMSRPHRVAGAVPSPVSPPMISVVSPSPTPSHIRRGSESRPSAGARAPSPPPPMPTGVRARTGREISPARLTESDEMTMTEESDESEEPEEIEETEETETERETPAVMSWHAYQQQGLHQGQTTFVQGSAPSSTAYGGTRELAEPVGNGMRIHDPPPPAAPTYPPALAPAATAGLEPAGPLSLQSHSQQQQQQSDPYQYSWIRGTSQPGHSAPPTTTTHDGEGEEEEEEEFVPPFLADNLQSSSSDEDSDEGDDLDRNSLLSFPSAPTPAFPASPAVAAPALSPVFPVYPGNPGYIGYLPSLYAGPPYNNGLAPYYSPYHGPLNNQTTQNQELQQQQQHNNNTLRNHHHHHHHLDMFRKHH